MSGELAYLGFAEAAELIRANGLASRLVPVELAACGHVEVMVCR